MSIPIELIEQISSMGIKDLTSLILSGKVAADAVLYIREKIKEKIYEGKYGYVPNGEEAKAIYEVDQKDVYIRLKQCLGGHWALELLRVGIYISRLNDEGKRGVVRKIKDGVFKKYGPRGIKIIDMGATGIIVSVASYLSDRKIRENLNPLDMALEFDKLLDGWDQATVFVKKDDEVTPIYSKILGHMDKYPLFFIFAYGSAVLKASKAIAKLNNEGKIHDKKYLFFTYPNIDQAGLRNNSWVFQQLPQDVTEGLI